MFDLYGLPSIRRILCTCNSEGTSRLHPWSYAENMPMLFEWGVPGWIKVGRRRWLPTNIKEMRPTIGYMRLRWTISRMEKNREKKKRKRKSVIAERVWNALSSVVDTRAGCQPTGWLHGNGPYICIKPQLTITHYVHNSLSSVGNMLAA